MKIATAQDRAEAVKFYHEMWSGAVQDWIDTGAGDEYVEDDVRDLAELLARVRREGAEAARSTQSETVLRPRRVRVPGDGGIGT